MSKPTYEQLEETIRVLQQENGNLLQENEKLLESEQIYRALFEHAGFSISLINPSTHELIMFNKSEHDSLGYTREEFENLHFPNIVVSQKQLRENEKLIDEEGTYCFETQHRTKNNEVRDRLVSCVKLIIAGEEYHLNIASDITELNHTKKSLKEAHNELEKRVIQKTTQVTEGNIALKVLLQKKDEEIKIIEERLLDNIRQLVMPHLSKLKKNCRDEQQLAHLIELELSLNEILSPFLQRLSNQYYNLTPTEIQIAAYIKDGKKSKHIAELLSVSMNTIEVHRDNLRKKLGLKHKKINLQSYLRTLNNT